MSVTVDDVITWFKPHTVLNNQTPVASHILSLTTYYDKPVSKWTRLYADCLTDIGRNPMNDNKLKDMSVKFIIESGKNETELNEMTKEDFVKLFALTMDKIIKDEETEYINNYCKTTPHNCKVVDGVWTIKSTGGKSKKSKKKSRKRNASKRRNRRTRNYKKK